MLGIGATKGVKEDLGMFVSRFGSAERNRLAMHTFFQ